MAIRSTVPHGQSVCFQELIGFGFDLGCGFFQIRFGHGGGVREFLLGQVFFQLRIADAVLFLQGFCFGLDFGGLLFQGRQLRILGFLGSGCGELRGPRLLWARERFRPRLPEPFPVPAVAFRNVL